MPDLLISLYPEELAERLTAMGEPAFRARQVFEWLHKGADYADMRNIPAALREKLAANDAGQPVNIMETFVSKLDGTEKYLFELRDGHCIEGVLMRYKHGATLCTSTQVGCRMGCAFCASTLEGCIRNLEAGEMLGQVLSVNRRLTNERVHNIVLMGSGEPLDNYDNVVRFLRLVSHERGLNIGLRHISLSTCGLTPQMEKLADEGLPVTLSVSLHAPNDAIRLQIMPIARTYSIEKLMAACRRWVEKTGRRIVFEYALIDGVNAGLQEARALAQLLRGLQCHVNLIPLNDVKERNLKGVTRRAAEDFLKELETCHISATIRREMGDDIQGACGQLRRRYLKLQPGEDERA